MIHWGLSSRHTDIQRKLYKGIVGIRLSDTPVCTHMCLHVYTCSHCLVSGSRERSQPSSWPGLLWMMAQAVHCTVQGIIFTDCDVNGPQKLCSVLVETWHYFENQKAPTTVESNSVWRWKFTGLDSLPALQRDLKLCSQHMGTHMYTLYLLHFPFPLIQADLRELPSHTSVPQMVWEKPQQIRGGELVHGGQFPSSGLLQPSLSPEPFSWNPVPCNKARLFHADKA